MANEGERSTSADKDKGKGKVEDVRELNGKAPQKDEKTKADGKKKDEEPQEGESPEDLCRTSPSRAVASVMIPSDRSRMLTNAKMNSVRRISN